MGGGMGGGMGVGWDHDTMHDHFCHVATVQTAYKRTHLKKPCSSELKFGTRNATHTTGWDGDTDNDLEIIQIIFGKNLSKI